MPRFASYDGTSLGYRAAGDGQPLVCLPGGPGRAADYLGDLGGLSQSRQLILLDPRGVGSSDDPSDPATLGVARLVGDVEALRAHLGLDRMDLLAHSAGAILATLYAAAFPGRLSSLILVTPGLAALGVDLTDDQFEAVAGLRRRSPGTRRRARRWTTSWPGAGRWRPIARHGRSSTPAGMTRPRHTPRSASPSATRPHEKATSPARRRIRRALDHGRAGEAPRARLAVRGRPWTRWSPPP